MPVDSSTDRDYNSLKPRRAPAGPEPARDRPSLAAPGMSGPSAATIPAAEVNNLHRRPANTGPDEEFFAVPTAISDPEPSEQPVDRKQRRAEKDSKLLAADRWLVRNGHFVTFIGIYLFSVLVLFRPYELVGALSFLSATAFYFAGVTLLVFFPSQFAAEGNLTIMSTEVKAILALTLIAIVTMPIAKDPSVAWLKFTDTYIKAVVIFIVLVNVVRTRKRLMSLMWLSLGIAVYLSIVSIDMYFKGEFTVESYRVGVEVGGMFGNPNEMAMHFVMMTPLAIVLGIASRGLLMKAVFFAMTALFIGANMVTFSRGGFLGLMATAAVLAWKIGRKQRMNVTIASLVMGALVMIAAPGNYGRRMLSIFIPALDPVGSSDQRSELLKRSLLVTARNPWGIGIGNFPIVGFHNLQSHNAFTQVSSELGILGLAAYLIFMISPFRKLAAIERRQFDSGETDWFYYLAIGLETSIIGYMVSSFFASVAYNWFIYYLIAYAVAFRRIYSLEKGKGTEIEARPLWEWRPAEAK